MRAEVACRRFWRAAIAWAVCAGLLLSSLGCGGTSSTSVTDGNAWATKTQQLCREKRAAIVRLGYIHITYAGIARVGLPSVKRSLESYLGRLLAVLRDFSQRQQQFATPPSLVPTMKQATEVDAESQQATSRLRQEVANTKTAAGLSAAFQRWTASLQRLAARGDALARQLNLPDCKSNSASP